MRQKMNWALAALLLIAEVLYALNNNNVVFTHANFGMIVITAAIDIVSGFASLVKMRWGEDYADWVDFARDEWEEHGWGWLAICVVGGFALLLYHVFHITGAIVIFWISFGLFSVLILYIVAMLFTFVFGLGCLLFISAIWWFLRSMLMPLILLYLTGGHTALYFVLTTVWVILILMTDWIRARHKGVA